MRPVLTSVIPAAITGAVVGRALTTNAWSQWGVEAMQPTGSGATSFADLANITATAQCIHDGADYTSCDPYGRPFQPYVVLPARLLAALGLGPGSTGALGTGLAVLYVLIVTGLGVFLALSWRGHVGWLAGGQVLLALAAISAPAMLAIERGQVEILVLGLVILALLALSARSVAIGFAGAAAAFASVVLKFFTVGLFAPFIRRGRPAWPALIGLAVSVVFLLLSWSDLTQAGSAARADQPATSKSQFGSMTMVATLLTDDPVGYLPSAAVTENWARIRLIGLLILAVAITIAALVLPRSSLSALDSVAPARAMVLGCAGVLTVPYLLGVSHDYRMVFLLPVIAGSLVWMSRSRPADVWVPGLLLLSAVLGMVTGAAMVATPSGFIWGRPAMLVGDVGLLIALSICAGVWVRSLVGSSDR